MIITERKLRRLFGDAGFKILQTRCNKHWVAKVTRGDDGPSFSVVVSQSPSDHRFERQFVTSLRRAEREAASR
jgi:hypothetical protein